MSFQAAEHPLTAPPFRRPYPFPARPQFLSGQNRARDRIGAGEPGSPNYVSDDQG